MLSRFDDLPLHQTPATLDQPASSDPAAYERFFFAFGSVDGAEAVGMTVTLHPNKGLLDAAFTMSREGRNESIMASDRLGPDRADLVCGPIRLQLTDPMRSLRISIGGRQDFDADIVFEALTPAIEEPRVTRLRANRVVQDRSRYVQMGTVRGHVNGPLGSIELTEELWFGGRDHSWGIWDAPKSHASDTKEPSGSFFWLIGHFPDRAVQAVTHADAHGETYGEYAASVPVLATGADLAGPGALQRNLKVLGLETEFPEDSWHFSHARWTLHADVDTTEELELESVHVLLPRAVGYSHPTWISGTVHSELPHVVRDGWNLTTENLLERGNHRGLQFVRMRRGDGAEGFGVTDQSVSSVQARPAGVS
jgi:hypothetical protein